MSTNHFFIPGEKPFPVLAPDVEERLLSIVRQLDHFRDLSVERCGSWLWVTGNTYHHRQRLAQLGFKFQRAKRAWSFHVETYRRYPHQHPVTLPRIRAIHGSVMYS